MPRQTIKIAPIGNIDRRHLVNLGNNIDVLSRENLSVIGFKSEERHIKKCSGSDRYNLESVGNYQVVSPFRYYGLNSRKNYFFSGGRVYFIDENGNTSEVLSLFNVNAYPTFVEMQVSSAYMLYFMEGISTGMYSHDGNISNVFQQETAVTLNLVDAVAWIDRMVGFEENSEDLYLSKNLEPTNFTDSTDAVVITIGAKRGSKLQKVIVGADDNLYIFKTDSTWVLEGKTPSEFRVREINPNLGLAARRSLKIVNEGMIGLMSDYEVYSFDGQNFKLLTYKVALSGDFTADLNPIINRDRMEQVASIYHNFLYRMSFVEDGQTQNDMEYVFNTINETEFFTRGNKVASYLRYDRVPDKGELVTGRSDIGRLMKQYHGLNYDNQASDATMSIKTKTKFNSANGGKNFRVRKVWLNSGVLGARPIPIRTYLDARNATSDSTSEDMTVYGEYKAPITLMKISSQDALTSRQIPRHANAKGQSVAFELNETIPDFNMEFSSFECEIIGKEAKRNHRVGV